MVRFALRAGDVLRLDVRKAQFGPSQTVRHPSPQASPEAIRREEVHVIRTYETVFITIPTLTDEEERAVVDALSAVVTDGAGVFAANDRMGRRRLAYPIKKFEDGVYTRFLYDSDSGVPKELDRRLRISDKVIRHMTVSMELDWATASKEQAVRDAQARVEAEAARAAGLVTDEAARVASLLTDASDAPPAGARDEDDIDFDDQN
jgi:small subunit ribosomal protein S6